MKSFIKHLIITLIIFSSIQNLYAASETDNLALIDKAGKQRMLSQKIAKAYFFYTQGIRPDKSSKQLSESIKEFNQNYNLLKRSIKDSNIQNMLLFVEMSKDELLPLSKATYNKDNGSIMLDYSETLLEASQDIVSRMVGKAKTKHDKLVNLSGRQRMLTQRIAKYYIAYQAGFKDHNTVTQLKNAMKEFEKAHAILAKEKTNTPAINKELNKIAKLWNVVNKFYTDVKRGGLPVIVLSTTDKMMTSMNRVTSLYVDLLSKKSS